MKCFIFTQSHNSEITKTHCMGEEEFSKLKANLRLSTKEISKIH